MPDFAAVFSMPKPRGRGGGEGHLYIEGVYWTLWF